MVLPIQLYDMKLLKMNMSRLKKSQNIVTFYGILWVTDFVQYVYKNTEITGKVSCFQRRRAWHDMSFFFFFFF
jgi:hypothetical protein